MFRLFVLVCAVFMVLAASVCFAGNGGITIKKEEKSILAPPPCKISGKCRVREIGFWTREYRVGPDHDPLGLEQNYGSQLYAWYETDSFATLTDYVFVQFIRGCIFASTYDGQSREISFSFVREHLGERKIFVHPEWTVDSVDSDPVFHSGEKQNLSRHYFAEWNNAPEVFPDRTVHLYGKEPPPSPRLFVTDLPSQSFWGQDGGDGREYAHNVSLEFRMCLYRGADIASTYKEGDKITAEPIACFLWRSSHIFDHQTKQFRSPSGIAPECGTYTPEPAPQK